ncbi:hypothetical protein [Inhella gelatinilytica]|uniref:Uncharacterized protein n=1 Tax=Inhella gelatinilytica TaxID=2795030 RepID=A0A931NEN8_9BURK|nr:hypothetical protein [Inhella gelatinilytica]MBH9552711.1 hypothetical protein [Inhella gelatinilytica]
MSVALALGLPGSVLAQGLSAPQMEALALWAPSGQREAGLRAQWEWETNAQDGSNQSWVRQARLRVDAQARQGQGTGLRLGEVWLQGEAVGAGAPRAGGSWQWRLGRQVWAWALTDTVSPGDLVNPRDATDPTRPVHRALWGGTVRWQSGAAELEALLARSEAAPLPHGAWAMPLPPGLVWAQPASPGGLLALRARWRTAEGAEWRWVAAHGPSVAPVLSATPNGLQAWQPRQHSLVLQALRPLDGQSFIRAELARFWKGANGESGGAAFTQWVLSVDREWAWGEGSVYGLLQWQDSRGERSSLGPDLRRALDGQWLGRLQWRGDDGRQLQLEAVGRRGESLLRIAWIQSWAGQWETEAGWQAVEGRSGQFWHAWAVNDGAYVRLRWRGA